MTSHSIVEQPRPLGGDGSALSLVVFATEADRRGLRTDELLARADLRRTPAWNPVTRVRRAQVFDFVERCCAASGDPLFHVAAALNATLGMFGPLDYIITMAPTMRDGARRVAPAFTLANSGIRVGFVEDDVPRPMFTVDTVFEDLPHFVDVEGLAAASVSRTKMATGRGIHSAVFRMPDRGLRDRMAEALGCDVAYDPDAKRSEIRWDPAVVDAPSQIAHPALAQLISVPLIASQTFSDRVVDVLVAGIPLRRVALRWVAESLGMTEKMLRKRLAQEGQTFRDLLRRARARVMRQLSQSGTLQHREIAALLGYTDDGLARARRRSRTEP